jgi:hypothetical protein
MEKKISMALIEETFDKTVIDELKNMKFIIPDTPVATIKETLDGLAETIENEFRKLLHGA